MDTNRGNPDRQVRLSFLGMIKITPGVCGGFCGSRARAEVITHGTSQHAIERSRGLSCGLLRMATPREPVPQSAYVVESEARAEAAWSTLGWAGG
ncbi:hypothetical protein SCMC78_67270 [Streptomyces sp. CMC78]|uniref:Uncharacterized protein n=1 Tax=Streptomyces sp. CMC78 TaxID=3231512 RepID=A0AB33KYU5_9ACTN